MSCAKNISLLQHIAMSLRFSDWRCGQMAVMSSYFDASGSLSELAIVPAALVATPENWVDFDKRWNSSLASFKVSALHMKHFAHSRGEFESWKNDQPKRRRFLNELLWIIEDHMSYSAASAVYIEHYNRMDKEHQLSEFMRPYTLGCLTAASSIVLWATQNGYQKNDLLWVFEKGDQDQDDLRKHWEIAYPEEPISPIFAKKKDRYPDSGQCRPIRPFEAADLLAYEHIYWSIAFSG